MSTDFKPSSLAPDEDFGPAHRRREANAHIGGIQLACIKEEDVRQVPPYSVHQSPHQGPENQTNGDKSASIGLQSTLANDMQPTRGRILDMSSIGDPLEEHNQQIIQPNCSVVSSGEFASGDLNGTNDKSSTPGKIGGEKTTDALNNITL